MAYPTPLLDARLAREKARNERERQRLLQVTLAWLSENAARYDINSGYIFGSLTMPQKYSQHSDIDLAVETYRTGDICAMMGGLSTVVLRDIDVVPLDQCHFAEKIRRTGLAWSATKSQS